jgi:hypothetical protein
MINVAVQAARASAFAAQHVAPHAPKIIAGAKALGVMVATDVIFNEFVRYGTEENLKARRARRAAEEAKDSPMTPKTEKVDGSYRIKDYPKWRRAMGLRPDETYAENIKRRTRTGWEVVCYAAGDALSWINLVTFKVTKAALGIAGSLTAVVSSLVMLIPVGLLRMVGAMKPATFEKVTDNIIDFNATVFLTPFRLIRWVDRKIEAAVKRMKHARSWKVPAAEAARDWYDANVRVSEVKIDEMADARRMRRSTTGNGEEMADVHHIFHAFIDADAARRNPKAYGRRIFEYEMGNEGLQLAATHRKTSLPAQLRVAGLAEGDVALVLQGYDEAVIDAASTPATATS